MAYFKSFRAKPEVNHVKSFTLAGSDLNFKCMTRLEKPNEVKKTQNTPVYLFVASSVMKNKRFSSLCRISLSSRIGKPGNTKGGSIIVLLTSFLTGLESAV
jgi:hypothetical protein